MIPLSHIQPLLDAEAELTHGSSAGSAIVLSTRIRLARNLQDMPFPGWANESQRRDILTRCREAVIALPKMKEGYIFEMKELSELERQVLVERHLISRELSSAKAGAAVVISKDQSCSFMINEEDHLRLQIMKTGFQFKRIWKTTDALDSALEDRVEMAFSSDLGYLTACPTNVGTGLRASIMMHLPGLVISGQMEQVIRGINHLGMTVRGLFGEGSDASGSIFQISNQQTLGETEEDIIARLDKVLHKIVLQEKNARARLIETNRLKLIDKIGRSYGTLRHGYLINSSEAMNFLSLIRLAVDLNLLPTEYRTHVDRANCRTGCPRQQPARRPAGRTPAGTFCLTPASRL
jgi:protein arginine kinase